VIGLLLQSKLIGDRQDTTAETQLAGQMLDDVRTELAKLDPTFVRTHGPEAANAQYETAISRVPATLRPLVGQRPDFRALDTPYDQRLGALTQEIAGITNPDDVRLTREGLRKRAPGLRVSPDIAIPNLLPGSGGTDSGMRVEDERFTELVRGVEGQRTGLLAREERTGIPFIDESGTGRTAYRSNRELGASGAPSSFQAERTALQEGQRVGTIAEQEALGEERGLQATAADRMARTVREYDAMTPVEMRRFARQEAIRVRNDLQLARDRARIELEAAGRVDEAKALNRLTTDATVAMAGLEEMAALATEVNSGVFQKPSGDGVEMTQENERIEAVV